MQKKGKKEIKGRFFLRTNQGADKEGKYPIYINYSIGLKHARVSTKIRIKECEWDKDKEEIFSNDFNVSKLNLRLHLLKKALDRMIEINMEGNSEAVEISDIRKILREHASSYFSDVKEVNQRLWKMFTDNASSFYKDSMRILSDHDDTKLIGNIHGIPTPHHWMYEIGKLDFSKENNGKFGKTHSGLVYHFLLEYDLLDPNVGIYYGCKCLWDFGLNKDAEDIIAVADADWKTIKAEAIRVLNAVFIDINFSKRFKDTDNANDNTYWPFWISLHRDEDIKGVGLLALKIIMRTYERYMKDPDSFVKDVNVSNTKCRIRTRFTDEAFKSLLNKIDGINSKDSDSHHQGIRSILFEKFLNKAVEEKWLLLDFGFNYEGGDKKPYAFKVKGLGKKGKKDNKNKDSLRYMLQSLFILIDEYIKDKHIITENKNIPWKQLSGIFLTEDGSTWSPEQLKSISIKDKDGLIDKNINTYIKEINGLMEWFDDKKIDEILRNL
ncbi:MAG: hypothetical protein K2L17_05490 [Muribaculaceae bacterium]|nr:hypothetical protein [Muribaculaceae bacterium]